MNDVAIAIGIQGKTDGGRVIKRTLDDIGNSADRAKGGVSDLDERVKRMSGTADMLRRSMTGLIGALGIRELVRMSDSVTMLRGRLENATRNANEAQRAFDGLRQIAQRTGAQMETTVSVFQRLSFVRDEINATMDEMLQFTDTVSKLGVVSGAGNEAMKAGLTQLGQALSANIVRAEEWNSIMENIPAVGVQIAKQFGVTTGQLRQLVIEGKVLSEDVFSAMLNSANDVEAQFTKMPMTIGRAFAALRNDLESFVGQTAESSGAAAAMIGVIDTLRVAIFGLGVAFSAAQTVIGAAGVLIIKGIENTVNGALKGINWMIEQANKLPGVDMDKFALKDWAGGDNVSAQDINKVYEERMRKVLSATRPQNTIFSPEELKSAQTVVREITMDYQKLAGSLSKNTDEAREATKAHNELLGAIAGARTEEERLTDEIAKMEGMRGLAKNAKEAEGLEIAIYRANVELDELRKRAERDSPLAKAFESLANQIDDGMRESFRNAFVNSDRGWKSLLDGWKAGFKAFLAEIAYTALMRPIVLSVVGGLGAAAGLSSGAMAGITGDMGGGAMGGNWDFSTLSSLAGGLMNGGLFSTGLSSVGIGVGNLLSGNGWNALPWQTGSALPGVMGQAFGNLGYGAIGGGLASLLGLGNANPLVNFATGTVGALGGSALGATLGSAGGPIGAVVGSFLGTALGGLFGGKKPSDMGQWGGINLADLETYSVGGMTGKKFSQSNSDYRDGLLTNISALVQMLESAGGTSAGNVMVHVGNRDGLRVGTSSYDLKNYGYNQAAFEKAVMELVVQQTTGLSETITKILKATGTGDLEKLAAGVEFGKYYDNLVNPQTTDALTVALDALEDQFEALYKQATDYGLSLAPLTTEYEKQKEAVTALIKAQQAGFASLEAMKATFDSWLYDQSLSSTSSLSPLAKLQAAQGNFGTLLDTVRGGDASKTQELLQAGQQLLQLGQAMYASSVDFALLEKFVRDSIGGVARELGVPGYATGTQSARAGMAWVGERGPELVRFNGGERVYNTEESKSMARSSAANDSRFAAMDENMAGMRDDIRTMNKQVGRLVSQMIATGKASAQ